MLPPLFEIGENVASNYEHWCERRKLDIESDASIEPADKPAEKAKVDDRCKAFREKFAFTAELRSMWGAGAEEKEPSAKSASKALSKRRVSTFKSRPDSPAAGAPAAGGGDSK